MSQTQLLGIHKNTSGPPITILGDDITTKNLIQPQPANFFNVFVSDFLNTETSSAQAAIFGRPFKSFSFLKGSMKIKLFEKL